MLAYNGHVITTLRSKQEYVMEQDDRGKQRPVKRGMAPIQRDGLEYEFTVVFDFIVPEKNMAVITKDRTSLFSAEKPEVLSEETGKTIMEWLNEGKEAPKQNLTDKQLDAMLKAINDGQVDRVKSAINKYILTEDQKLSIDNAINITPDKSDYKKLSNPKLELARKKIVEKKN